MSSQRESPDEPATQNLVGSKIDVEASYEMPTKADAVVELKEVDKS